MTTPDAIQRRVFQSLLDAWSGGDANTVLDLVTDDYVGHMLHRGDERTRDMYPARIAQYAAQNPGTTFRVLDQRALSDGLFTRVEASRPDGAHAYGMNQSRFVGPLIAEEWAVWSDWRVDSLHPSPE